MKNIRCNRRGLVVLTAVVCLALGGVASAQAAGTTPTVSEFLNAANAVYMINATPAGMTRFTNDGQAVTLTDNTNGAVASVYVTAENQVIIAYQGTTGGLNIILDPVAAFQQVITDIDDVISDESGGTPAAYTSSLNFAKSVISLAKAQGYTTSNIFVTGHSLGGIEAEYTASQTGLGGISFEPTGIAEPPASGVTGANFVNTVTYGDPVASFSSDIQSEQPTAPPYVAGGGQAPHFGSIVFLGTPSDETTLTNEFGGTQNQWFGSAFLDPLTVTNAGILMATFHLPGVQAHDLNVTLNPTTPIVDGVGDMSGQVLKVGNMQIPALIQAAAAAGRWTKG
jgi:hypothetical protein